MVRASIPCTRTQFTVHLFHQSLTGCRTHKLKGMDHHPATAVFRSVSRCGTDHVLQITMASFPTHTQTQIHRHTDTHTYIHTHHPDTHLPLPACGQAQNLLQGVATRRIEGVEAVPWCDWASLNMHAGHINPAAGLASVSHQPCWRDARVTRIVLRGWTRTEIRRQT